MARNVKFLGLLMLARGYSQGHFALTRSFLLHRHWIVFLLSESCGLAGFYILSSGNGSSMLLGIAIILDGVKNYIGFLANGRSHDEVVSRSIS